MFQVSPLRESILDQKRTISYANLVVEPDNALTEHSVAIIERGMRRLRSKDLSCQGYSGRTKDRMKLHKRLGIVSRGTIQSSMPG